MAKTANNEAADSLHRTSGGKPTRRQLVSLFVPSLFGGGAERVMLTVAGGLVKHGWEVDLVLAEATGPYLTEIPAGVRLVDLKTRRIVASVLPLVRYLRQRRPDALLTTLRYANVAVLLSARLARVSTRVLVRESNTSSVQDRTAGARQRIIRVLARHTYPWSAGIVAVSEGVAADLREDLGLAPEKIRVIHNPVALDEIDALGRRSVSHPWLQEPSVPILLSAGRLTEQKDFATLIDAFARARARRDLRLVILGEGELRPQLDTQIRELGLSAQVSMPGFVRNPFPFMARAALFVLSSRWEGFPNVLLQALASGCPVVSTDCRSGPRELLEHGRFGALVPVGDPDALAAAILRVLEAPKSPETLRRRAGDFAPASIIAQYDDALLGPSREAAAVAADSARSTARGAAELRISSLP
jgi:glycosyltransferase involved in cell wall biosynthesis